MNNNASTISRSGKGITATERDQPDKGVSLAVESIRQNPKFKRLLNFQLNALVGYLTPPNSKHKENGLFIISSECHLLIIKALQNFTSDDSIVQNSSLVMRRLIGEANRRNEDIVQALINGDAISAINATLNDQEYLGTKESMKELLGLIGDFVLNPAVANKMIDQSILESIMASFKKSQPQDSSQFIAIEAILSFLSFPNNLQKVISRNILPQFSSILQLDYLSSNSIVAGFRVIQKIIGSAEGLEYVKKCNIVRVIVVIMSKFPSEKALASLGSFILGKIINEDTIKSALQDLKKQSGDLTFQSALLSNLVFASQQMDSLIEKGEVVKEVLGLLKRLKDNCTEEEHPIVLRNSFLTLARISTMSSKQAKSLLSDQGLDILSQFIESDNPQVFVGVVDTFQLLLNSCEGAYGILNSKGIIKSLLDFANTVHAENVLVGRSLVNFLFSIASQKGGLSFLAQSSSIFLLIKIFKANSRYKLIAETVIRIFSMLSSLPESTKPLTSKVLLEQILEVCNNHPEWRKYCSNALNCISELLDRKPSLSEDLKKMEIVETMVSIVSKKAFVLLLNQAEIEDNEREEDNEDLEVSEKEELQQMKRENKVVEEINEQTEKNIFETSVAIVKRVSNIEEIMATSEQVESIYQESMEQDTGEFTILLEMAIIKLALGIVGFEEESLEMGVHSFVLQLSKNFWNELNKNQSVRTGVQSALTSFFVLTSLLFESNLQTVYLANRFIEKFFEFTKQALQESKQSNLRSHLDSLNKVLSRVNPNLPTVRVINLKKNSKQTSFSGDEICKWVAQAMGPNIVSDFNLIKLCLTCLSQICQISQLQEKLEQKQQQFQQIQLVFVSEGVLKFIVNHLELFLEVELGLECIKFLTTAAQLKIADENNENEKFADRNNKKGQQDVVIESLYKLKTSQIILNYISQMNGSQILRNAASQLLEILSVYAQDHPEEKEVQKQSNIFMKQSIVYSSFTPEKITSKPSSTASSSTKQQTQPAKVPPPSVQQSQKLEQQEKQQSPLSKQETLQIKKDDKLKKSEAGKAVAEEDSEDQVFLNLIQNIDPDSNSAFCLNVCSITLEEISNTAIIDKGLQSLLEVGLIPAINNLLGYVNMQDENDLAIKGLLFISERILVGTFQLIVRMLQSTVSFRATACTQIAENLLIEKILYILTTKYYSISIIENAVLVVEELLKDENLRDEVIDTVNKNKYCSTICSLVDKTTEEQNISTCLSRLLLILASLSLESANQIATKEFLKQLLRKLRQQVTSELNEQQLQQLEENVRCLMHLSLSSFAAEHLLSETSGIETLLIVLKHQNQNQTIAVNIASIVYNLSKSNLFQNTTQSENILATLAILQQSYQQQAKNKYSSQLSSSTYSILLVLSLLIPPSTTVPVKLSNEISASINETILKLQTIYVNQKNVRDLCASILQIISFSRPDTSTQLQQAKNNFTSLPLNHPDILTDLKKLIEITSIFSANQESGDQASTVKKNNANVPKPENKLVISKLESLFKQCKDREIIAASLSLISAFALEGPEMQKEILESNLIVDIILNVIPFFKMDEKIFILAFKAFNSNLQILETFSEYTAKVVGLPESPSLVLQPNQITLELPNFKKSINKKEVIDTCIQLALSLPSKVGPKVLEFLGISYQYINTKINSQLLLESVRETIESSKIAENYDTYFEVGSSGSLFASSRVIDQTSFEEIATSGFLKEVIDSFWYSSLDVEKAKGGKASRSSFFQPFLENLFRLSTKLISNLFDKSSILNISLIQKVANLIKYSDQKTAIQALQYIYALEIEPSASRIVSSENLIESFLNFIKEPSFWAFVKKADRECQVIAAIIAGITQHKQQIQTLKTNNDLLERLLHFCIHSQSTEITELSLFALRGYLNSLSAQQIVDLKYSTIAELVNSIKDIFEKSENIQFLAKDIQDSIEGKKQGLSSSSESSSDLSNFTGKEKIGIDDLSSLLKLVESDYPSASFQRSTDILTAVFHCVNKLCGDVDKAQHVQSIGLAEALISASKETIARIGSYCNVIEASPLMELIFQSLNQMYQYPRVVQKSKVVSGVITIISSFLDNIQSSLSNKEIVKTAEVLKWAGVILGYAGPFQSALLLVSQTTIIDQLVAINLHFVTLKLSHTNVSGTNICGSLLESIAKLCSSKVISSQFLKVQGINLLDQVFKDKKSSELVIQNACYSLGKASQNNPTKTTFLSLQGYVVDRLRESSNSIVIYSKCCFCLASMVFNNEECAIELLKMNPDLIKILIKAAKKNMKETELLSNICMLVNSICYKNPVNKRVVGETDVILLLLDILKEKDIADSAIQQGLKTVGNLSLLEDNSYKIIELGLVQTTETILNTRTDKEVRSFSAEILLNVCAVIKKSEKREQVYACLIKQNFYQFIFKQISSPEIDENILKLMADLIYCTIQSDITSAEFTKLNGIKPLGALLHIKTDLAALTNILRVIQCLILNFNAQTSTWMISEKIHSLILNLIPQMKDNKFLQKSYKILTFLVKQQVSQFEEHKQVISSLLQTIDISSVDTATLKEYLIFFTALFPKMEDLGNQVAQKILPPLISSLQDKIEDSELVEISIDLIEKLALVKSANQSVIDAGPIALLCEILKKYLTKHQLTLKVLRCLEIISSTGEANQQKVSAGCLTLLDKLIKETSKIPELYKMLSNAKSNIQKGTSAANRQSLITQELKDFVTLGTVSKLFKSNGTSSKLKIFVTPDLMEINCKKENKTTVKPKWKLAINMIQLIKSNFETDQLSFQKSNFSFTFRKKAEPETCFAIIGPPQANGRKSFYVQCISKEEKEKWVKYLNDLLQEAQESKKVLQEMF